MRLRSQLVDSRKLARFDAVESSRRSLVHQIGSRVRFLLIWGITNRVVRASGLWLLCPRTAQLQRAKPSKGRGAAAGAPY
jgi:hypothetical protein